MINGVKTSIRSALADIGENIVERSTAYVPVRTGFLRDSVRQNITESSKRITLTVKYTAPYAIYVHENLENNHPNGGQAKFLDRAVKEILPDVANAIRTAIARK
ncbi:MAG: HK97 gp10 family phage protein [Planctomycetaceae bacterium]|jgi:hypothetical protein|nr:HK97 gp10 family phage protein [Planctomycetaceae bacterium]